MGPRAPDSSAPTPGADSGVRARDSLSPSWGALSSPKAPRTLSLSPGGGSAALLENGEGGPRSFPPPRSLSPHSRGSAPSHGKRRPGTLPCLSINFPVPFLPLLRLPTSPSPAQPQARCFGGVVAVAAPMPTALKAPCNRWALHVGDRDGNRCH